MIINAFENGFLLLPNRPPSFQGEDEGKEFLLKKQKQNIL